MQLLIRKNSTFSTAHYLVSEQNCYPLDYAFSGGEDYELIFTTTPQNADELRNKIQREVGVPVTIVGEITTGSNLIFEKNEQNYEFHTQGWNHFSSF